MLTVGSLFSGIGGFDLGLERAGMTVVWQVEIDEFCNKVLAKHWPNVRRYRDVREVGKHNLELEPVDLICGGFPCQDISLAGTGKGLDGERSGLWSEYARIIRDIKPRWVVVENSPGLLVRGMGRVLRDLAESGYDAEWEVLSAQSFGAPHRRERVFLVAYSNSFNGKTRVGSFKDRTGKIFPLSDRQRLPFWLQTPDRFIGMDDGISRRAYENRGKALGNAVVPQIVEVIGRAILAVEQTKKEAKQ